MSTQSMIDEALEKAKARLSAGVQKMDKTASAPKDDAENQSFLKQATEVADALEYVALATADDGSAAGAARQTMTANFFKQAATAAGPAVSETTTAGTQSVPPMSGSKKIQPGGKPGDVKPESSDAPEGQMAENVLRQTPPATAPTPTDKGGKTANASATLYDILMSNKHAAGGGPVELDSEQALPQTAKANEGKAFADSILGNNQAPVSATKRDAKAPTRPRLAEVWDSAKDTAPSMAAAKAVAPQAAAKGGLKVAELARAFSAERVKEAEAASKEEVKKKEEPKTASALADYSEVFEAALSGKFGDEVQNWATQIEQAS
jgi:hypothetical protein